MRYYTKFNIFINCLLIKGEQVSVIIPHILITINRLIWLDNG